MAQKASKRQPNQAFAKIVGIVDAEIRGWQGQGQEIKVRKCMPSPAEVVWTVEWHGQPIGALAARLLQRANCPCAVFLFDNHNEVIDRLHAGEDLDLRLDALKNSVFAFLDNTILTEAKRAVLREGLFARFKDGDLAVLINGYEFCFRYYSPSNKWRVSCEDLSEWSWKTFECPAEQNPLSFLIFLIHGITLSVSL
jgi:hypothetical protein